MPKVADTKKWRHELEQKWLQELEQKRGSWNRNKLTSFVLQAQFFDTYSAHEHRGAVVGVASDLPQVRLTSPAFDPAFLIPAFHGGSAIDCFFSGCIPREC